MKLSTIMYLHESVNGKPLRAKNTVFWRNISENLDYIKDRHIYLALPCIASLVKCLYKFHEKPPKIGLLKVSKIKAKTAVSKKLIEVI